jgi:hypothetical protein
MVGKIQMTLMDLITGLLPVGKNSHPGWLCAEIPTNFSEEKEEDFAYRCFPNTDPKVLDLMYGVPVNLQ